MQAVFLAALQQLLQKIGIQQALATRKGHATPGAFVKRPIRQHDVQKVIAKVNGDNLLKLARTLGIETVISPKLVVANRILRYVRAMDHQAGAAITVHSIADGAVEASEFLVTEQTLHCGEPLREIKLKKNILVAGITRGAETKIPDGESRFEVGDFVVIVAPSEAEIYELNDIFDE